MRPVILLAIALGMVTLPPSAALAFGAPPPRYRPPVTRPVIDPFRSPVRVYGAGNRGLEYDTRPGDAVRAIGPGVVVFSGAIAGHLYVTVFHPDGLRSSYSYLAALAVPVGRRVEGGAVVGTAGERMHLGVRRGTRYLDPARLFVRGRAILVPNRRPRRVAFG